MSTLLPFHKSVLEKIHDPLTSELLLLARGLGLRRIVCKLLQIYESPQNLVLLVNASPEEESAIGEELGIMGCRKPGLRVVGYEMGKKDRQNLYKKGGLISVTSQILTVDMLTSEIPTHLITGIMVLHAERVTPTSAEAFIIRLYREKNRTGFLKAFSDQPEHITSGMSPLRTIMKELQLRSVHIYPRFHQEVNDCLDRDRDAIQINMRMTESMTEIHGAIVQCISSTLSELKRSNTSLDLDDLTVENVYFKSFDIVVRKQLDPVWYKVGPRTKQLVSDLATLRRLLGYLLTYDALAFHAYLETLIASNTTNHAGNPRQNQSLWMLTDAAHIIFSYAKRRCYTMSDFPKSRASAQPTPIHDIDDVDAWAALDEVEGIAGSAAAGTGMSSAQSKERSTRKKWLPEGMDPVLEEMPKWTFVAAALQEIDEEMIRRQSQLSSRDPGTNTVLVMTSSLRTSQQVSEFLSEMDPEAPPGTMGRKMMEEKLRLYLWWKSKLSERNQQDRKALSNSTVTRAGNHSDSVASGSGSGGLGTAVGDGQLSEALRKKDKERQARTANRRRVRGGAPASNTSSSRDGGTAEGTGGGDARTYDEAQAIVEFLSTQGDLAFAGPQDESDFITQDDFGLDYDTHFGLLTPEQTVLVRVYSDDTDDQLLAEIQPRYIIMFEPNLDFVRRVEVYKKSYPGLGVRVYLLLYEDSCEEAKYLAGVRRERESFERLIKERGSMLMPILEERRSGSSDTLIKTISTRIAGGRKEINHEPSRTIADVKSYAKASAKYPVKKKNSNTPTETTVASPLIQTKLVLLVLAFPRVRIIWSSSPYATAEIFNDLKMNHPEPDPAKAITVGAEEDPDISMGVNAAAEELLRSFPGITAKNVKHVMSKVNTVRELCELPLPKVQEILGVQPGKACWEFIHHGERKR